MDYRSTTLVLVATLAGTGTAQAGNISGIRQGVGNGPDQAVGQFVGFMLAADENPAVRVVTVENLDTGSNPDAGTFVVGAHNFAFDGSSIISEMLSSVHSEQMSLDGITDGSWHVSIAPPQGVFGDAGGLANPTVIPLPVPFAMGGIGLLSLGGFAAWKRRARG